jgi:ADP-heptose:LPS heptosyltransferase
LCTALPPVTSNDRGAPLAEAPRFAKLLVIELWGIGDLTMATSLLAAAVDAYEVTLLGKPHARALLAATYPQVKFIEWNAPWTAFTRKYRLWRWNWSALRRVLAALRKGRFDVAVSGRRADPRDHLLMRLAGIPRRVGYPHPRTPGLLNEPIDSGTATRHVVNDWRAIAGRLKLNDTLVPHLNGTAYSATPKRPTGRPVLCLHAGARIPVRRWPEAHFAETIRRLRLRFDFDLLLIPDPDGYGLGLAPLADRVIETLLLEELVGVLASCAMLLCNDSGPGHVAAACGRPVLAVFGPTAPTRFSPWGPRSHLVVRDLCPHRPCMDKCRFPEPYCLTRLTADEAWPEIESFAAAVLPARA